MRFILPSNASAKHEFHEYVLVQIYYCEYVLVQIYYCEPMLTAGHGLTRLTHGMLGMHMTTCATGIGSHMAPVTPVT